MAEASLGRGGDGGLVLDVVAAHVLVSGDDLGEADFEVFPLGAGDGDIEFVVLEARKGTVAGAAERDGGAGAANGEGEDGATRPAHEVREDSAGTGAKSRFVD